MSKNPFKSIAAFLFVFTFISHEYANGYTAEEAQYFRLQCWNIIQFYFGNGNDSDAQAQYAWDTYTIDFVKNSNMPLDARDFYLSFKKYLIVFDGYIPIPKYCAMQDPNEKARCNKEMDIVFGGSPRTNTEYIMYERSKAMLLEENGNGNKIFGDYIIPYWDLVTPLVAVKDNFPCAQKFCEERYKETVLKPKLEPVLLDLFPIKPDLNNNV